MHTSIRTTDAIYEILSENDVRKNIQSINARIILRNEDTNDEIKNLLITMLDKLED